MLKLYPAIVLLFSLITGVHAQQLAVDQARPLTELAITLLNKNLDSSKLIFEKAFRIADDASDDTLRAGVVSRYGEKILHVGEKDYLRRYLVLVRNHRSFKDLPKLYQARIYNNFFDVHYWSYSDYDSCLYYANKWIEVSPDSVWLAYGYLERGASYAELGNNLKALEAYNTSQNTIPSNNTDMDLVSSLNNNFGMMYSAEHEYEKAAEYFERALHYARDTKQPAGNLPMLNNLGVLNLWMGKYEKSLEYLRTSAELLPAYDRPWATANNIQNQGNALTLMGKPREGLALYEEAMVIFEKLGEAHKIAGLHRLKAEAYRLLGDYKKAENEALQCLNWDLRHGSGELVKESYQELYKIYSAMHQYDKAFDYQSRYLVIIDSLNSAERKTQFGLLEKNFELEQQESIRERLENENQLHLAQAETDRVTRLALIVGSIALAIGVVIAVMAYRRSRLKSEMIEGQAQQLREAAKAKSRFFANISHELRTPVTLLNGMLELMKDNMKLNGSAEKMEIALGNSRKLQSMLNDVLDLSRLEEGKWELQTKRREILPILNRIVLAFESLLVNKNIELRYEASDIDGLEIDLDEDKFEKIINNLMYNAVKFNRDGGWIKVTAQRTTETVVIQVADSGIGIPEKELSHIFDRHYQSAATDKLNSQGTGIGLALVREFTILHGGDVTVTSRLNEGSCFTIQLPIKTTAPQVEVEPTIDTTDVSFDSFIHKPNILLVEDNDDMRYYLKEILGSHVSTSEATNGRAGLDWLQLHKPDLIISDVMMPGMDGYEFLSQLKNDVSLRGIPVIMLTARATEEDLLQGLRLGVDDYIIKPFNAKELKIRIHNLLTNQEIRREWTNKPPEPNEIVTPSQPTENEMFLEKVKEFVESNASNANLGIGDLGEYLAMSERQVYRKAATLTGMTPGQLIKEIRLRIAYKLLLERKVTKVSDLAQRVGFENASYFSRQFLERYGKRPADLIN